MIKRIEGVQRRATTLMLPNLSYNERLKRLDLLPLVYHREVKDLSTCLRSKAMIEETYYHSPHSLVTTLVCGVLCLKLNAS